MTDRELLELAAKAAGIEGYCWNPLYNDGDALRLAVKLNIRVEPNVIDCYGDTTSSTFVDFIGGEFTAPHNNDPYAATRRAIVLAAAEMGRG
jgi:hypothetical protein